MDVKAIVALIIVAVAFVLALAGVNGPIFSLGKLTYHPNGCVHFDQNVKNSFGNTGKKCEYEPVVCRAGLRKATFAFDIMACIFLVVAFVIILLKVLHSCISAIPEIPRVLCVVVLGLAVLTTLLAWILGVSYFAAEHTCKVSFLEVKIKLSDGHKLGWGVILMIVSFVLTIPATVLGAM